MQFKINVFDSYLYLTLSFELLTRTASPSNSSLALSSNIFQSCIFRRPSRCSRGKFRPIYRAYVRAQQQ